MRILQTGLLSICRHSSLRRLTTQQLQYAHHGDPEKVVELKSVDLADSLTKGEVLVKWVASPINPADINQIQGVYPVRPPLPAVGGNEGYGIVEKTGEDVKDVELGDCVIPAVSGIGCWRRHGIHKMDQLWKIATDLPMEAAATLQVNPPTAYRMLKDYANLSPGDYVIQNGANSAVGKAVIQIAKATGLRTINVVRDRPDLESLVAELTDLGANYVLTEKQMLKTKFDASKSPKLGLNCVGGRSALLLASSLAPDGVLVTYGGMSKQPLQIPTGPLIFKRIRLCGFWMSYWYEQSENAHHKREMYTQLAEWIKKGQLKSVKMDRVPMDDFRMAIERTMAGDSSKQLIVF